MADYLAEKKEMVKITYYILQYAEVNYEIPQGSVLGPLLFSICIIDIASWISIIINIYTWLLMLR